MPTLSFDITDEQQTMLTWAAQERETTVDDLVAAQVQEFLVELKSRFMANNSMKVADWLNRLTLDQQLVIMTEVRGLAFPPEPPPEPEN